MTELRLVGDKDLVARIVELAKYEREMQVELIRYLAEMDRRQLYLGLGYGSLWDYCRRGLKFSEGTSQRRILVARASGSYPALLAMLGDGRLTLCTAADLVPLLTAENHEGLLAQASGRSRVDVQRLGVPNGAKPVSRDHVRRVPAAAVNVAPERRAIAEGAEQDQGTWLQMPPVKSEDVSHRVSFTAPEEIVKKLEALQELLGGATLADVIGRAADRLLDEVDPIRRREKREAKARRKTAAKSPKAGKTRAAEPRRPPAALRDKVIAEAGRQCEFVSADGVRCAETRYLSVDHVRPYALGGSSTDENNLRCYCVAHNLHAGRETFGRWSTITSDSACRPSN